jgi:acyl carrier protein
MVETQVRQILAKHSGLGPAVLDIDVAESLWDRGMTSMAAVRVLVALEEGFAVEFPDDKLSTGGQANGVCAGVRGRRGAGQCSGHRVEVEPSGQRLTVGEGRRVTQVVAVRLVVVAEGALRQLEKEELAGAERAIGHGTAEYGWVVGVVYDDRELGVGVHARLVGGGDS